MATENTKRRNIYLSKSLDDWFITESDKTDVKVNDIILKALGEYAERNSKNARKKKSDFEKEVRKIALNLLNEKGLI